MISVVRVYNIVRDLCNKDQKGFISPNVFNSFAAIAQQNIYNEMFDELKMATALRRSGRDGGRDKSAYKMKEEDLSMYIRNVQVTSDINAYNDQVPLADDAEILVVQDVSPDGAFTFRKPTALNYLISMTVIDTNTSVELIHDNEKANRVLNSNLSAPTPEFPIALVMDGTIQVFPTAVEGVLMRYYRNPQSRAISERVELVLNAAGTDLVENEVQAGGLLAGDPVYAFTDIDEDTGFILPDLAASRNFDLPSHRISELVFEMCQLIGIRLRDNLLTQYGLAKDKEE